MFGDRLGELRKSKGLTQREIATKLHMPTSTYVGYELNNREPDFQTFIQIADFFGVTTDYLLGRIEKTTKRFFEISGMFEVSNNENKDYLLDIVVEICEARGWLFGGVIKEVNENGEDLQSV